MLLDRPARGSAAASGFVLYVEGARDRDILRAWAQRFSPPLGRAVASCAVILGGRQPARAASHFRAALARGEAERGLCVLDRDDREQDPEPQPGLEFFTWRRRHIESYLLAPEAIRRCLRLRADDPRVHSLRDLLAVGTDEARAADCDAKRLLARHGALARSVGFVAPGRIARAMRPEEYHPDVRALLDRLRGALGIHPAPLLVRATGRGRSSS